MLRRAVSLTARRGLSTLPEVAPVTMFGTSGRYANALYAAAAKNKALLDVQTDLSLLKDTLSTSPALLNFCTDPSLGRDAKAKGIMEVLTAAKANDTTKKAMAALAEGGRLGDVVKVIDMYSELITAAKGEVKAVITSAEPLPAADKDQIVKQLTGILVRCATPRACFFFFSLSRLEMGGRAASLARGGSGAGAAAAVAAAAVSAHASPPISARMEDTVFPTRP